MGFLTPTGARRRSALAGLLLLASATSSAAGEAGLPGSSAHAEYEVKAAMLYNFVKFIDWPADALGEAGAPFVIGILGNDPFGARLDAALRDKKMYGRPIVVRRFAQAGEIKGCQVLFFGVSERNQLRQTLHSLAGSAILTVGEGEHFVSGGGAIGFILDDRRIRFEINLDAANRARLQVSSKLLRLATVRRDASPQARNQ